MKIQPEIKNGIKPYIEFQDRPFWDELRQGGVVSELAQYILEKNKSKNKSFESAVDLAIILFRKCLPTGFNYFTEVIKHSSESELQEIIENVELSPDVNLTEQLMVVTAGYYGIKGKQRSIDFFTWIDLLNLNLDKQGYRFLSKLRQNPRPLKIDTIWQFTNLIYGLNIGPNLGCKLTRHDLHDLRLFPHLDFSYLEDYEFPEFSSFNLEMFIKAGGTYDHVKKEIGQLLLGLNKREYLGFWHAKLKSLPLRHYGTMRIGSLLR